MIDFWKGKKVLITGHTGFKGSWLSLWLKMLGAEVIGYSLQPPTKPNLFHDANVGHGMISVHGDIRDLQALVNTFNQYKPTVVFHLAAQPLVRKSYTNPVDTFETNVLGTVNLFEAIRASDSVHAVVNVTSDKCYENKEWVWGYRENDPMGGHDPYSASKGCAELITSSYIKSFFPTEKYQQHRVGIASVRAGNVIGGGDWAEDRLVPDIFRAILANRSITIRNPNAYRPWQHVLEPLHGYMKLAEQLWSQGDLYSGGWNFGPNYNESVSVSQLVENIVTKWEKPVPFIIEPGNNPHEAHLLKLDCSKANMYLGWKPLLSFDETLDWVVEWYRAYSKNENVFMVTTNQIAQFERLLKEQYR